MSEDVVNDVEVERDVGRILGAVARRKPMLVNEIRAIAKARGVKVTDLVIEALEWWKMHHMMMDIDPKALAAALALVEHLMTRTVELMVQLGKLFTSDMVRAMLSFAREFEEMKKEIIEVEVEGVEKEKKPEPVKMLKQSMVTAMMPMMMQLVTNLMTTMMQMVARTGGQAQMQPPPITQLVKTEMSKVEVEE